MAERTPNYDLEKATGNEYYEVELHGRNMDKIDSALGDLAEAVAASETPAGSQDKADAAEAAAKSYADDAVNALAGEGNTKTVKQLDAALTTHENKSASTSEKGHVQLNNTVTSTSTTQAATANAVKQAYDKANHSHPYASQTEFTAHLNDYATPHTYEDEGDDEDYIGVKYRLVFINGKPCAEVVEA